MPHFGRTRSSSQVSTPVRVVSMTVLAPLRTTQRSRPSGASPIVAGCELARSSSTHSNARSPSPLASGAQRNCHPGAAAALPAATTTGGWASGPSAVRASVPSSAAPRRRAERVRMTVSHRPKRYDYYGATAGAGCLGNGAKAMVRRLVIRSFDIHQVFPAGGPLVRLRPEVDDLADQPGGVEPEERQRVLMLAGHRGADPRRAAGGVGMYPLHLDVPVARVLHIELQVRLPAGDPLA